MFVIVCLFVCLFVRINCMAPNCLLAPTNLVDKFLSSLFATNVTKTKKNNNSNSNNNKKQKNLFAPLAALF